MRSNPIWSRMADADRAARIGRRIMLMMLVSLTALRGTEGAEPVATMVSLERFEKAYDDAVWVPATGRLARYLRPADDLGWKARMTAFATFARQGDEAVMELTQGLESESAPVRALAAQSLGYVGAPPVSSRLAKIMESDPDPLVRLYAADSLGMLGGQEYEALLKRLIETETNSDVKRHLQYALDRQTSLLNPADRNVLKRWNPNQLDTARLHELAPDFQLTSVDGQTIQLSQYRGQQSVILVFVYGDT